jgi:hypothetical protein
MYSWYSRLIMKWLSDTIWAWQRERLIYQNVLNLFNANMIILIKWLICSLVELQELCDAEPLMKRVVEARSGRQGQPSQKQNKNFNKVFVFI